MKLEKFEDFTFNYSDVSGNFLKKSPSENKSLLDSRGLELKEKINEMIDILTSNGGAESIFGIDTEGNKRSVQDLLKFLLNNGESCSKNIEVLYKQFDEQVKNMTLANPSTAEIVAIRTGIDGKTYTTAGGRVNAIQESITQCATKTELENLDSSTDTKINSLISDTETKLNTRAQADSVYTKTSIDSLLSSKRDNSVTIKMADLDQEVKKAMTGGSVAVVGDGAVGTDSVMNNAITNAKIANSAVGRLKQIGSVAQILTKDSIEVNIKDGLIKIKNAPYIFTDTTSVKFGQDNTNFNMDKTAVLSKAYCLHADMATLSIEFEEVSKITNPYMTLCYIVFSGNINNVAVCYCGNNKSVKVYDNQGAEIVEKEHSGGEQGFIYPANNKQIDIVKVENSNTHVKLSIKEGTYLLATNYAKAFTTTIEQTIALTNNKYLNKIYYNTTTSKFELIVKYIWLL